MIRQFTGLYLKGQDYPFAFFESDAEARVFVARYMRDTGNITLKTERFSDLTPDEQSVIIRVLTERTGTTQDEKEREMLTRIANELKSTLGD